MSKVKTEGSVKTPEAVKPATFSFEFFRSEQNPKLWTCRYMRDGVVKHEIMNESDWLVCAANMERKMRLALFE